MKTQEKFKKNQTEWNNSNIDICDFNAFFFLNNKKKEENILKNTYFCL